MILRSAATLALLLVPAAAIAACPPGTVARGVYTKYCYPVATGSGSGGGGYGGAGAQLGREIGTVFGGLLRDALFGNPQAEAERQAAIEAQQQWEQQQRQERARQDDERYRRLSAALLDFKPAASLSLMGGQPGGGGLQLMLGEEAERSVTNPAAAELARAAAWSTLAARANTPEESAMLANAAFQSLLGERVNLPQPPPDVQGVPVGPHIREVEPLKRAYLESIPQLRAAERPVLDAEYRRELAVHAEEEASFMARRGATPAIRTQGNAVRIEAARARARMEAELKAAQEQMAQRQASSNDTERSLRGKLGTLARVARPVKDDAFYKGFQDGSLCFSLSAANFCRQAGAGDAEHCEGTYRLGYAAGEKIKKQVMQDALDRGRQDKLSGRNYADTDPRAQGSCRYEYVMSYNAGYFGARLSLAGQ